MSDVVDKLNRKLKKFTSDQRNKGSAPTSTISKNELCFYHNRYGNRAHKCVSLALGMQMTQCLILKRII